MLINVNLANKKVATPFGEIVFNAKGETNDLKAEEQKVLGALPGFEYKEDKKPTAPKAPTKEEAPKEDVKVQGKKSKE